jgi:Sulfotransferase family
MQAGALGVRDGLRVIYLGGLGRSGSTLLERLLGELPGVSALGEVVHMWRRGVVEDERCGCGEAFSTCSFWTQVGKSAFDGWDKVSVQRMTTLREATDRTRFIPRLAARRLPAAASERLTEYTDHYLRVYEAVAEVTGSTTLIDSSKHASLAFCLSRRPEIDLRVVHLVRDSRAVAYSWTTRVARPDASAESYMTTYPPVRAAAQWNIENYAIGLLARRGTPVLRVRYEDLVAAPQQTMLLLAAFAGLRADPPALDFIGTEGDSRFAVLREAHTASGNPMRFATGKVGIRGDERWRTAMPDAHRRTVTAMTLPLLKHYGYLRRAG